MRGEAKVMKRPLLKAAGSVFILAFACYLAYAFSTGITGQTKKSSATAGCGAKASGGGGCHGTSPNANIQVLLSGPAVLPVGTSGTYTISLTGALSSGGGCDIAVSSGSLSPSSNVLQFLNQELTHVSPVATPYSIEFTYLSNSPGSVTMYANGKASSGWNWAPNLSIRVGPPPAPTLLLPADGSSAVPTSVVLVWSGIQGPRWSIEVSPSQSFAPILVQKDSLSDTTYTIPEGVLANNMQYFWKVGGSDSGGTSAWSQILSFTTALTGVKAADNSIPKDFALEQNYPNPFNPVTVIKYTIGGDRGWELGVRDVSLIVYDVLGREVATLVNEKKAAGSYEVNFSARGGSASGRDGSGLASGVYIYRLTAGTFVQSRTMLLVK